jgi:hypothetical protein
MFVPVTDLPHATHQRARPWTLLDAMNGRATSPLRLLRQLQIVEIGFGLVVGPVIDVP